jgi:hypothetical protein
MRSRVYLHRVPVVAPESVRDAAPAFEPCKHCMAKWVLHGAAQFDASQGLRAPPGPQNVPAEVRPAQDAQAAAVEGLDDMLAKACLKEPLIADRLRAEVVALGAICARELSAEDWQGLPSWTALRALEQRRLLVAVRGR